MYIVQYDVLPPSDGGKLTEWKQEIRAKNSKNK